MMRLSDKKQLLFSSLAAVCAAAWMMIPVSSEARALSGLEIQGFVESKIGRDLDGDVEMRFSLYPGRKSETVLWTEKNEILLEGGVFKAVLGTVNPLPDLQKHESLWLGWKIGAEELGRLEIGSVAYAASAERGNALIGETPASPQPILGTSCPEGEYLREWDPSAGAGVCEEDIDSRLGKAEVQSWTKEVCGADAQQLAAQGFSLKDHKVDWDDVKEKPEGLGDGSDADTRLKAGVGVVITNGIIGVDLPGADLITEAARADHTHDDRYAAASHLHRVLNVGQEGSDFSSIQAAIDEGAKTASEELPSVVLVTPGIYAESIVLAPHVHVRGLSPETTWISGTGTTAVTMADHSSLEGVTVKSVNGRVEAVIFPQTLSSSASIKDVHVEAWALGSVVGIQVEEMVGGGVAVMEDLRINLSGERLRIAMGMRVFGRARVKDSRIFVGKAGLGAFGIQALNSARLFLDSVEVVLEGAPTASGLSLSGGAVAELIGSDLLATGTNIVRGAAVHAESELRAINMRSLASGGAKDSSGLFSEGNTDLLGGVFESEFVGDEYDEDGSYCYGILGKAGSLFVDSAYIEGRDGTYNRGISFENVEKGRVGSSSIVALNGVGTVGAGANTGSQDVVLDNVAIQVLGGEKLGGFGVLTHFNSRIEVFGSSVLGMRTVVKAATEQGDTSVVVLRNTHLEGGEGSGELEEYFTTWGTPYGFDS